MKTAAATPIIVNILLFHIFIVPAGLPIAGIVAAELHRAVSVTQIARGEFNRTAS